MLCTIALALYLQSVWALVIGYIIGTSTMAILSHVMLPGPPNRIAFHRPYVGRMLRFGGFVFIASAGSFLLTQGDRVILGKLVTLEQLGLYTIAFFLAVVPIQLAQALSGGGAPRMHIGHAAEARKQTRVDAEAEHELAEGLARTRTSSRAS